MGEDLIELGRQQPEMTHGLLPELQKATDTSGEVVGLAKRLVEWLERCD